MEDLRVVLVSDDPLARSGLATLISGEEGFAIVAQISVDEASRGTAAALAPGVVVFDLGPDPVSNLDALRDVTRSEAPTLAILWGEDAQAEAIAAGARGVLHRDADGERLGAALRALAQGLVVLDPAMMEVLLPALDAPAPLLEPLTPREREVLGLLSQGLSNKLIAEQLGISDHTAKFHINGILGKLGVRSRTEAIVQAAKLGLIVL